MTNLDAHVAAIAHGLLGAMKAVPGRRMTSVEVALSWNPETEIAHCVYLAGRVLPQVTGKAKKHASEGVRLLRQVRAIINPELEKFRNEYGLD